MMSNCPFDEYQGSGYVIVNTMNCLKRLGHIVKGVDNSRLSILKFMGGRANRYRMALGMANYVLVNRARVKTTDVVIFYGAECFAALWVLKNLLHYKGKTILHSNGIEMQVDLSMLQGKVNRYQRVFQWNMHPLFLYAYRNIDQLITVSAYERDFAIGSLKMPPGKVALLEPSLHPAFFIENRGQPEQKPIILYCGGWLPIKGVAAIQEALPAILTDFPDYTLRLIGVGESFQKEKYFPGHLLSRVVVIPSIRDREKLIDLFSECRFFIFPSLADSFGLVVAEAMHCGCVAIVSGTGLGYSLVHKQEAWVLKESNSFLLQEALAELIKDEALCNRMRLCGKKRVQGQQWGAYQIRLSKVLTDLLCNSEN